MIVNDVIVPFSKEYDFLLRVTTMYVLPGKREFQQHFHPEIEIVLFKSGTGTYAVEKKEYAIRPGDVFLFGSNEIHKVTEINKPYGMEWVNIHFEPRFIWSGANQMFDEKYLQTILEPKAEPGNQLNRNDLNLSLIRREITEIQNEAYEQPKDYEAMSKAHLLVLLVALGRYFGASTEREAAMLNVSNYQAIERVISHIKVHYAESLTLDELARIANMSSSYLSTVFKKLNGISLWDYITSKRINCAIEYLKKSDISITEAALKSGFNNNANFNYAFKKLTGRSPSQFRVEDNF